MTHVAVAAPSAYAARASAEAVRRGGGAVDAAIAAAIAAMFTEIGVAAPGAGAFIAVSHGGAPAIHDGYMAAPGLHGTQPNPVLIRADMEYGGGLTTHVGPASVAVPGAWAAFDSAHREHGRIAFADIVAPTIEILSDGFSLGASCLYYLGYSGESVFGHDPASFDLLHRNGVLVGPEDVISVSDAASILERIGVEGPASMLTGSIGASVASDLWERGSLVGPGDFAAYRSIERKPLSFQIGDWLLYANPPPAVGGAGVITLLEGLISQGSLGFLQSQEQLFRWRRGPLHTSVDRETDIRSFLRSLPGDPIRSPSTVHVSAVDSDGSACALTLSAGYGSGVIPTGTGLYMNNGIGELELVGDPELLVAGERLNSNMAPSIMRSDGGALFAVGSPGADRISSALATVIGAVAIEGRPLREAIHQPRVHVAVEESGAAVIKAEPGANFPDYHLPVDRFEDLHMYFGGVGAAMIDSSGRLSAEVDPRRPGVARVWSDREN